MDSGSNVDFLWRVYLADGTSYDNTTCEPWDVPIYPRTLVIAQPAARGRDNEILVNGTWYVFRADEGFWFDHDRMEDVADEFIEHALDILAVRKGKRIVKVTFNEIWKQARQDMGLKV